MTRAELEKSLASWKRKETSRKKLHTTAQQDLLEARAAVHQDLAAIKELTERRDLRSRQLKEARKNIADFERRIISLDKKSVRRPHERIVKNVRNRSSRNGVKPRIIVLHSTESHNRAGLSDLQAIVAWFDNPSAQASSHVLVDDEGISARTVPDADKAWTQAAFNPQSLSIEMIGLAAQGRAEWTSEQIEKVAQYLAYWAKKFDIPLVRSTSNGVTMHMDLGPAGGGHHDPGANFPIDRAISRAKTLLKTGW